MCKKIKINGTSLEMTEAQIKAEFQGGSELFKQLLVAQFGENFFRTPSLDDYKSIKTYEDACTALGEEPLNEDALLAAGANAHVIALMKLETISKALWGRDFKPVPQAEWDGETWYYFPWFAFYSKKEVERIKENRAKYSEIAALFGGDAAYGAGAGFGSLTTTYRPATTNAYIGFRLCQQNEERARYFGAQFAELWAEYLAWGFKIEERII